MKALTPQQWEEVNQQFAEIGYCCLTPKSAAEPEKLTLKAPELPPTSASDGFIDLGSGKLTVLQLKTMLNHLPVEITFVNKDDLFSYFNKTAQPIFVRTNAALGLQVQRCHPQKSVHLVNQILTDFKSGVKDMVDFWIHLGAKYVYIRYFALRDESGEYIGCMEVTQDLKGLQEIKGEKRLMGY